MILSHNALFISCHSGATESHAKGSDVIELMEVKEEEEVLGSGN